MIVLFVFVSPYFSENISEIHTSRNNQKYSSTINNRIVKPLAVGKSHGEKIFKVI